MQRWPMLPKSVSSCGQRDSGFRGFATIFAGLELDGLLCLQHFAAKISGYASR
jgi:hypothetical protein